MNDDDTASVDSHLSGGDNHAPDVLEIRHPGGGGGAGSAGVLEQPVQDEDVFRMLTGNVGLKPLLQQHKAMVPVPAPYAHQREQRERRKPAGGDRIPEPLYRKAKLAAHMKEMVKVPPAAAQNYGFGGQQPLLRAGRRLPR